MKINIIWMLLISSVALSATKEETILLKAAQISFETITNDYKNQYQSSPCEENLLFVKNLDTTHAIITKTLVGCGGGNHFETYAVIVQKHGIDWFASDIKQVGDDQFVIENMKKYGKFVIFLGLEHYYSDPQCCPTQQVEHVWHFDKDKLSYVR